MKSEPTERIACGIKLPKNMLSVNELAYQLGISRSMAAEIMRRLPCVNLAAPGAKYRLLRVRQRDVDRFLKQVELACDY